MFEMKHFKLDLAYNVKPLVVEASIKKILFKMSKNCFKAEMFQLTSKYTSLHRLAVFLTLWSEVLFKLCLALLHLTRPHSLKSWSGSMLST